MLILVGIDVVIAYIFNYRLYYLIILFTLSLIFLIFKEQIFQPFFLAISLSNVVVVCFISGQWCFYDCNFYCRRLGYFKCKVNFSLYY